MINLSTLNQILDATEQQQMQESSIAQKAAESAATPQEYKLSPEAQSIVDEVQKGRERDEIRRRLMVYNDAMMQDSVNRFAGGSSIHIDPSKKGTFTAAASRHGMGVQEFASRVLAHKENYSPAMVKKANFARNASKFHHAFGGPIEYADGGYIEDGLRRLGVTGFRVTSGYRGPNSKVGHAGKRSGHARTLKDGSSGAIDIVPTSKTASGWANLEAQLRSPAVQNFLAGFGGTIFDERDPATMLKTGATGPHFHVGLGIRGGGNFYGHNHDHSAPVQSGTGMGGYFAMPQTSEPLAIFGNEPQQDSFVPWWQVGQTDENFLAQQAAGAAGGAYDISQFQPSWIEPVQNSGTFPQLFVNGGYLLPINSYGGDGSSIMTRAPRRVRTETRYYSTTAPSDNTTNVVRTQTTTKAAVKANSPKNRRVSIEEMNRRERQRAESIDDKLFGDTKETIYKELNDSGFNVPKWINKLDTLSQHSAYLNPVNHGPVYDKLNEDPFYHLDRDLNKPFRATIYRTPRWVKIDEFPYYVRTKPNTYFFGKNDPKVLHSYLEEFSHVYQHSNDIPEFKQDPYLLVGRDARTELPPELVDAVGYKNPIYNEYKAHHIVQPLIEQYLKTDSLNYDWFVDSLKKKAAQYREPGVVTQKPSTVINQSVPVFWLPR